MTTTLGWYKRAALDVDWGAVKQFSWYRFVKSRASDMPQVA